MRDMSKNMKVTQLLKPDILAADTNSASIDMQGFDALMLIADVGERGDTWDASNHIQLEVEHSDNDSDWTDCADADILDAVTGTNTGTFAKLDNAADDILAYKVGYIGGKRYVRAVLNFTGTHSTGSEIGIIAVQCRPGQAPVA